MKKRIFLLSVIFSFVGISITYADDVKISLDRLNEKVLIVWGGEVYKDQVVAIKTEKGIVIIDTGKSPTLTAKYRKIIEEEFQSDEFIYVINTHYHFDHTSGNQVFPEATIISHQDSPGKMIEWDKSRAAFVSHRRNGMMKRWKTQMNAAKPGSEDWVRLNDYLSTGEIMLNDYENNYSLTLPNLTFTDELNLDLGDMSFKLYYYGKGCHTGDDIIVYIPEENLLFTGDLFYKKTFAFAYQKNIEIERWIKVLNKLCENEIEWVYDCHNGRISGDQMKLQVKYMNDLYSKLYKAKKQGLLFSDVETDLSFESKFTYLRVSGFDDEALKKDHINNLKFLWEYFTQ